MVDHAIPLRTLRHMMSDDPGLRSIDALRSFLQGHYRLGVLTFAENARLNAMGLVSRMPDDWNGRDAFARYAAAGIEGGAAHRTPLKNGGHHHRRIGC